MNALEELHKQIDESDWDVKDEDTFNRVFQEVNNKLEAVGEKELLHKSERERETFSFQKSPKQGLHWKFQGTKTLEDGRKEPFDWPDIKTWEGKDFDYIHERFKSCKNQFARSEYGLLLFYVGKLAPSECKKLFDDLLKLSQKYYESNKGKEHGPYRIWDFYNALNNALHISFYKKNAPGFTSEFEQAIKFAEQIHKSWKEAGKSMLRNVIDMTGFVIKYYDECKEIVDVPGFYDRNNEAAEEVNKSYTWGAIYIIDVNIKLNEKLKKDTNFLLLRKAQLYEKLADEAEGTPRHLAAVNFVETALRFYRNLNDTLNIKRMEERYSKLRGTGTFNSTKSEAPEEEKKRIAEIIKYEIENKNEEGVLENFVSCPMYSTIEMIRANAEQWKKDASMMYMFGTSIVDKYGNTIARYPGQSDEWAFLQWYGFSFQTGTQILLHYFFEGIKSGKLNATATMRFLEQRWMNESIKRNYNRFEVEVVPLELLRPVIKTFFKELVSWINEPNYTPDMVTITDSMVLKIEAILRYLCDKLSIPTFRTRDDGLVMERNLDELLSSLEHKKDQETYFDENDRKFIKFVLSEQAGENLRNKIAHGLLDINEYTVEKSVLAFTIIMRLSKYSFTKKE